MAFHSNFNLDTWTALLICGILCVAITTASICYIVWQLFLKKDNNSSVELGPASRNRNKTSCNSAASKIHLRFKVLSIACLAFFVLAQIFHHLYVYYNKLPAPYGGPMNRWTENTWTVFNSCWSLAYGLMYLLFFERLRTTFCRSAHALSKCTVVCVLAVIFMFMLLNQTISLLWLLFTTQLLDWDSFNALYEPLLWTKFGVDWIFNIVIVYLFCSKIYKITLQDTASARHVEFANQNSMKLYQSMIRYFALTFTTVLSTQVYCAAEISLSAGITRATNTHDFAFYYKAYAVYFCFGLADTLLSTMYVMLSFPFGAAWYDKLCGCFHRVCVRLWAKTSRLHDDHKGRILRGQRKAPRAARENSRAVTHSNAQQTNVAPSSTLVRPDHESSDPTQLQGTLATIALSPPNDAHVADYETQPQEEQDHNEITATETIADDEMP